MIPWITIFVGIVSLFFFYNLNFSETQGLYDFFAQALSLVFYFLQLLLFFLWANLFNKNSKATCQKLTLLHETADTETAKDISWLVFSLEKIRVPTWPLGTNALLNIISLLTGEVGIYFALISLLLEFFFLHRLFLCSSQLISYKSNFYAYYKVPNFDPLFANIFPKRNIMMFLLLLFITIGGYLFFFFLRFSIEINLFLKKDAVYLETLTLSDPNE